MGTAGCRSKLRLRAAVRVPSGTHGYAAGGRLIRPVDPVTV